MCYRWIVIVAVSALCGCSASDLPTYPSPGEGNESDEQTVLAEPGMLVASMTEIELGTVQKEVSFELENTGLYPVSFDYFLPEHPEGEALEGVNGFIHYTPESNLYWIEDDRSTEALRPGETTTVTLFVMRCGLSTGTWQTTLQIRTSSQTIEIPVSVDVGPLHRESIFRESFENGLDHWRAWDANDAFGSDYWGIGHTSVPVDGVGVAQVSANGARSDGGYDNGMDAVLVATPAGTHYSTPIDVSEYEDLEISFQMRIDTERNGDRLTLDVYRDGDHSWISYPSSRGETGGSAGHGHGRRRSAGLRVEWPARWRLGVESGEPQRGLANRDPEGPGPARCRPLWTRVPFSLHLRRRSLDRTRGRDRQREGERRPQNVRRGLPRSELEAHGLSGGMAPARGLVTWDSLGALCAPAEPSKPAHLQLAGPLSPEHGELSSRSEDVEHPH